MNCCGCSVRRTQHIFFPQNILLLQRKTLFNFRSLSLWNINASAMILEELLVLKNLSHVWRSKKQKQLLALVSPSCPLFQTVTLFSFFIDIIWSNPWSLPAFSRQSSPWNWSHNVILILSVFRRCVTHHPPRITISSRMFLEIHLSIICLLAFLHKQESPDFWGILSCLISSWAYALYRFYTSKPVRRSWGALLHMRRKKLDQTFWGSAESDKLEASVWTEDDKFDI